MLNYQSAEYHDPATCARSLGKRPTPEFDAWLDAIGLLDERGGIREVAAHPLTAIGKELAA